MNKYVTYIRSKLDERTLLEQLAEETAELTQAVLKLIRAKELSDNVTPIGKDTAQANFDEEIIDINLVIGVLYGMNLNDNQFPKLKRWAERLGYKDE